MGLFIIETTIVIASVIERVILSLSRTRATLNEEKQRVSRQFDIDHLSDSACPNKITFIYHPLCPLIVYLCVCDGGGIFLFIARSAADEVKVPPLFLLIESYQ
jgi:hypothetical protein